MSQLNSLPKTTLFQTQSQDALWVPIDLSVDSIYFQPNMSLNLFHDTVFQYIHSANANGAYGGYLEKRNLYQSSERFNDNPQNVRYIHLGVDFWVAENTPVLVPYDGLVHSFANNDDRGNYGPTIILEHHINQFKFYTLFGHLSLESIQNLKPNQIVKQGELLAYLGNHQVNGGYPPHLHFQLILDLQGYQGDYPGVSASNDLEFYKNNCPNPLAILQL